MTSPVIGNGPVEFTTSVGKQVSIPLSALLFDSSGTLTLYDWPPYSKYSSDDQKALTAWLEYLADHQLVTAKESPPPQPALILKAVEQGDVGNHIAVAFKITQDSADPSQVIFDITVTQTDIYPGLSVSTIKNVLGTETQPVTQPGLVHVLDASVNDKLFPDASKSPYQLTISGGNPARVQVPDEKDSTKFTFTLEAKGAGNDSALTTVTISHVNTTDKTFTLTAVWIKTVTGVTITTLEQKLEALSVEPSYSLVKVSLPSSGVYSVPQDGSYSLSGGTNTTAASAIIFTRLSPPKGEAMKFTATDAGSTGNDIVITIAPNPSPDNIDFTVTKTDVYPGLSVSTIKDVLGTETKSGTKPGLVHVLDASVDNTLFPDASKSPYQLTISGGNPARVQVPDEKDDTKFPFTLEAKGTGDDGALTTVMISDVNTTDKTFTLTAVWSKTVTGITIDSDKKKLLPDPTLGLSYLVQVSLPSSGVYSLPAAGLYALSGGTDGGSPTKASQIIPAFSAV